MVNKYHGKTSLLIGKKHARKEKDAKFRGTSFEHTHLASLPFPLFFEHTLRGTSFEHTHLVLNTHTHTLFFIGKQS